jgi:hypothetical protein
MLHFPLDKLNVVYIVICDRGEAECLQEVHHHCMALWKSKMPSMEG